MSNLKNIKSALVSVYYKDGLEEILLKLHQSGVKLYSTGGTKQFIEGLEIVFVPSLEEKRVLPHIIACPLLNAQDDDHLILRVIRA